jgi:REP element-mobilizing transposase RayT
MPKAEMMIRPIPVYMRPLRELKPGVWYEIRTRVNNREPLFRRSRARTVFTGVFRETAGRFAFAIRGFRLTEDWLTFYIKPAEWRELPAIMKWMKQVFAQRYNREEGRIGHLWGDRYWSRILEGGDERGAGRTDLAALPLGVRPHGDERPAKAVFPFIFPPVVTPKPG